MYSTVVINEILVSTNSDNVSSHMLMGLAYNTPMQNIRY